MGIGNVSPGVMFVPDRCHGRPLRAAPTARHRLARVVGGFSRALTLACLLTLLRAIDPHTGGEFTPLLDVVSGAREWRTADLAGTSVAELARLKAAVQIQALDATGQACTDYEQANCNTLRIGLREPAPMFHALVALPLAYPAREEDIAAGGENWSLDARRQIGNGSHSLQRLDLAPAEPFHIGSAFFLRSDTYWRGSAYVDIEYLYVSDPALSLAAYENDELDVIPLRNEDVGRAVRDPRLRAQLVQWSGPPRPGDVPPAFAGPGPGAYLVQPWVQCFVPTWLDHGWPGLLEPLRIWVPEYYIWSPPVDGTAR